MTGVCARALLAASILVMLSACGSDPQQEVESYQLQRGDFVVSLRARGELRAAESTAIGPPPGSRIPRTIAWMAPNHSWVTRGEVIVHFDASNAERELASTGFEIEKVDIDMLAKQRELERLLSELGNDLDLVDIEKLMAEQFNLENELAYSRFEIIDAMRNKELLDYKVGHFEGKKVVYQDRQSAESAVLTAMRDTQESKQEEHQNQVNHSEVVAPHDGFLVYEKTWWGQSMDVGTTVFPGNNVATIPNLDKMEAVLQVLETEAVGLSPGQRVSIIVDAYPDKELSGTLSGISAAAAAIDRDSPVKYFSVTVALDQADPEWITPETQVTGEIHIAEVNDTIAIPNQALYQDEIEDWVLVREGGGFVRRPVDLGLRSANRSQVLSGLTEGDEIALHPPGESS